jgi:phenylalanyl-tRNA synthetase beta chain
MHSEAVRRFERGVDPDVTRTVADHASYWFALLAGGTVAPGLLDVDAHDHTPVHLGFDVSETGRLLGKAYSQDHVTDVLERLHFGVARTGDKLDVTVPSWRLDVRQPADIVEEVARITGYGDLTMAMPDGPLPSVPAQDPAWTRRMALEDELRELLKGAGFSEAVNYTLQAATANGQLVADNEDTFETPGLLTSLFIEPIKLANAMSEEQEYLRTSMLPGLVNVCSTNRRFGAATIRFYEIGQVFWQTLGDLPDERNVLALLATGPQSAPSWHSPKQPELDFFDLKGVIERILAHSGINARFEGADHPALHPGRTAQILARDGHSLGYMGELHPTVAFRLDLGSSPVLVAELDMDAIGERSQRRRDYHRPRRFPPVVRQLTVALDASVPAENVESIIRETGGELLADVTLADVFELGEGKRSLSYAFVLQSDDRTLTDEEANEVRDRILEALKAKVGASQR